MKELLLSKQQEIADADFSLDLGIQDFDNHSVAPTKTEDYLDLLNIEEI